MVLSNGCHEEVGAAGRRREARRAGRRAAPVVKAFLGLAGGLAVLAAAAAVQAQTPPDRFSRVSGAVLDVAPPMARVSGARGAIVVRNTGCISRPLDQIRRRMVDISVQEWAAAGFQTIDAAVLSSRRVPGGVLPDALNPHRSHPFHPRALIQFGLWEVEPAMDRVIAGYWAATPGGAAVIARQNQEWRQGEGEQNWVQPWSAAFISWTVCEAGLAEPSRFRRDASHRTYIDQAIRVRDGRGTGAYTAYSPGERPLVPGDLLCNTRGGLVYRNLGDRRRHLGQGAPTHCDIVVRVAGDRVAVIGGNVIQSVSLTILPLSDRSGSSHPHPVLPADASGAHPIFAHLSLNAAPIEAEAMDASPTIAALNGRP